MFCRILMLASSVGALPNLPKNLTNDSLTLRLQIAQSRSYLYTLGPKNVYLER